VADRVNTFRRAWCSGGHEPALFKPAPHAEGNVVDRSGLRSPARWVSDRRIDLDSRRLRLQPPRQALAQLRRAGSDSSPFLQLSELTVRRPEELERLPRGPFDPIRVGCPRETSYEGRKWWCSF